MVINKRLQSLVASTAILGAVSFGAAQTALTLSGTLEGWEQGEGTVLAYTNYLGGDATGGEVGSGTIEANGSFSFEMPEVPNSDLLETGARGCLKITLI